MALKAPIVNPWFLARFLARPQHSVTGTVTPSGRFTLGTPPKKGIRSRDSDRERIEKYEVSSLQTEEFRTDLYGHRPSCALPEASEGIYSGERDGPEPEAPLGLSKPDISHNRGKRGSRGISAKASNHLIYWMTQFERRWGRANISFLTLTVPNVAECDRKAIQDNWSEITRRYVQELKREIVRRNGRTTAVLGCTEIQLERSKEYGWDVPHLHLVFYGKSACNRGWMFSPEEVRGLWQRVVSAYLSNPHISFRASENIQRVKKSVAKYLGKYLSKSKSKCRDLVASSEWFPSDYCIIPANCRRWFRANSAKGFDIALHILEILKIAGQINGFWTKPITVETSIGEQVIGWVGVNPDWIMNAPKDIWDVP